MTEDKVMKVIAYFNKCQTEWEKDVPEYVKESPFLAYAWGRLGLKCGDTEEKKEHTEKADWTEWKDITDKPPLKPGEEIPACPCCGAKLIHSSHYADALYCGHEHLVIRRAKEDGHGQIISERAWAFIRNHWGYTRPGR